MLNNFEILAVELSAIQFFNSRVRLLLIFKLNVSEASAAVVLIVLQLAGLNTAICGEKVEQLLLTDIFVKVLDEDVSFFIEGLFSLGQ
jgi:hypothetical protein